MKFLFRKNDKASECQLKNVEILIKNNATIDAADIFGETPLHKGNIVNK